MAPELLAMDINREWLTKADIFSLGLTLYAAASLKDLPKNSLEDPEYENIKAGQLPYLESYSKDFNALLKVCVFSFELCGFGALALLYCAMYLQLSFFYHISIERCGAHWYID